jgi:uncharacterized membrane protein
MRPIMSSCTLYAGYNYMQYNALFINDHITEISLKVALNTITLTLFINGENEAIHYKTVICYIKVPFKAGLTVVLAI